MGLKGPPSGLILLIFLLMNSKLLLGHNMSYFQPVDDGDKMKKSILINEPGNYLPNQFTICASVFITYFKTPLSPFMLLKEDGSLWFNFVFVIGGKDSKYYRMYLYYGKKSYSNGVLVPLVPHTWSHTCLSVNIKTKRFRVVFNELVVFDDTIGDVGTDDKPRTLGNRLIMNFVNQNGKIHPTLHSTGNVNIYGKDLSIKKMETITSGFECQSAGNYQAWEEMFSKYQEIFP